MGSNDPRPAIPGRHNHRLIGQHTFGVSINSSAISDTIDV
jgi:hypothetical protein